MKRAYSVQNVKNAKFKTLDFDGVWLSAIGKPELTGTWFIYGDPKNGKTTFALMLAKYLTKFSRVAYNSVEEGLSLTMQMALERVGMEEVGGRFILLQKEEISELVERLDKHVSPDVVFLDSVQFADMNFSDYKMLKARFPHKLFVYISHKKGREPDGRTATRIWRDANVAFNVEGFRAFPVGRYGGGESIDVNERMAEEYWGLKNN
jgi:hypothetical protein